MPYGRKAVFILVFELPMRDGNNKEHLNHKLLFHVFELPMRDGNWSTPKMDD